MMQAIHLRSYVKVCLKDHDRFRADVRCYLRVEVRRAVSIKMQLLGHPRANRSQRETLH